MAFMDFLLGKGQKTKTRPIYTPEQEELLGTIRGGAQQQIPMLLQNLMSILGGGQEQMDIFAAPFRREFQEQILPSIAERFTGFLGEGSQRSSAFGQQIGAAGAAAAERIAAQRQALQQQAGSQWMQLLGPALAPLQQQFTQQRQPGFLENLAISAAPAVVGGLLGGPAGAVAGGVQGATGLIGKYKGAS